VRSATVHETRDSMRPGLPPAVMSCPWTVTFTGKCMMSGIDRPTWHQASKHNMLNIKLSLYNNLHVYNNNNNNNSPLSQHFSMISVLTFAVQHYVLWIWTSSSFSVSHVAWFTIVDNKRLHSRRLHTKFWERPLRLVACNAIPSTSVCWVTLKHNHNSHAYYV